MDYLLISLLCLLSYFVGCINFGKILASAKHVDLSKKASGNLGAANMFRNMGAKLGYLTLTLDALKGVLTSLTGYLVFGGAGGYPDSLIGLYACGLSAVIGHIFPIINKFKGGKGISTALGMFVVSMPLVMLVVFIVAFIVVWIFKVTSVASLLVITVGVVAQNLMLPEPNLTVTLLTFAIFVITWFAHRKNIERLILGRENETNIRFKIRRDQKMSERLEMKQELKEIKIEERHDKKEVKLEEKKLKSSIKEVKSPQSRFKQKRKLHTKQK
ncbi:MAG: glycerol-3-phosphate acyltransferase [Clostridia bacterium]|nr:glycerol-3-phosphate acyltransferase [Clostridia bacterium]